MSSNCSVNRKFIDYTCFKKEDLNVIAHNLNECRSKASGKLKFCKGPVLSTSLPKKELYSKIKKELKMNEIDWIKQKFLKDFKMKDFIFKPKGGISRGTWLNNLQIDKLMRQYTLLYNNKLNNKLNSKLKDKLPFIWHGVVGADYYQLPDNLSLLQEMISYPGKQGIIFNTDREDQDGSHWVAVFINKTCIEYFDSNGVSPNKYISAFLDKLKINNVNNIRGGLSSLRKLKINKIKHQTTDCVCGIYAIKFILHRLFNLDTFKSFTGKVYPDNLVNKLRQVYFTK